MMRDLRDRDLLKQTDITTACEHKGRVMVKAIRLWRSIVGRGVITQTRNLDTRVITGHVIKADTSPNKIQWST